MRCPTCGLERGLFAGCLCDVRTSEIADAVSDSADELVGAQLELASAQQAVAKELAAQRVQQAKLDEERARQTSLQRMFDNRPEMHKAVQFGDAARVKQLLEAGANVGRYDDFGYMPLHVAAYNGEAEIARLLLGHGAEVNAMTTGAWRDERVSSLFIAARTGHPDVMQALIDAGADVSAAGQIADRGNSVAVVPLDVAVGSGDSASVRMLVAAGADVKAPDGYGDEPLVWAYQLQDPAPIMRLLKKAGARINHRNNQRRSPLHTAAAYGNVKMATELLDAGATVDAVDKDGKRPVQLAHENRCAGCAEVERLLLARGAAPIPVPPPAPSPAPAASGGCMLCLSLAAVAITAASALCR